MQADEVRMKHTISLPQETDQLEVYAQSSYINMIAYHW